MLRELIVFSISGLIAWEVSKYVCLKYMKKTLDRTELYNKEITDIVINELNKLHTTTNIITSFDIDKVSKEKRAIRK